MLINNYFQKGVWSMSGHHGKMSGSPFHVINVKSLCSEQYGESYTNKIPDCKYYKNGLCYLPQNAKDYKKKCAPFRCNYINEETKSNKKRDDCVYAYDSVCLKSKLLNNCSEGNDLSFCCQYFASKNDNPKLYAQLCRNIAEMRKLQKKEKQEQNLKNKIKELNKREKRLLAAIKANKDSETISKLTNDVIIQKRKIELFQIEIENDTLV